MELASSVAWCWPRETSIELTEVCPGYPLDAEPLSGFWFFLCCSSAANDVFYRSSLLWFLISAFSLCTFSSAVVSEDACCSLFSAVLPPFSLFFRVMMLSCDTEGFRYLGSDCKAPSRGCLSCETEVFIYFSNSTRPVTESRRDERSCCLPRSTNDWTTLLNVGLLGVVFFAGTALRELRPLFENW